MRLFLYEVVARIVAAYFCYLCGRQVWDGLIERKIALYSTDLLDIFFPWREILHRDTSPIRYWMIMGTHAFATVACFITVIIGWQPSP